MHCGRTKLAHVIVAVLLAIGLSVCWAFVLTMVPQTFFSQARRAALQAYDELAVRSDGLPLVVTQDQANNRLEIRHLDGAKLDSDEPQQQIAGAGIAPPWKRKPEWSQRVLGFSASNDPTWWYLVHDGRADGNAYVIGFDRNTKQRIGFVGKNGFHPNDLTKVDRIPFRGNVWPTSQIALPHGFINPGTMPYAYMAFGTQSSYVFLLSEGNLMRMDLARRRFETVYQAGDLQSISVRNTIAGQGLIASTTADATPPKRVLLGPPRLDELVLRTKDALLFADSEGNVSDRFVLPEDLRRKTLTAYLLPDRKCLCLLRRQSGDQPQELIWLQPDGKITARQELDLNDRVVTSVLSNPLYEAVVFPVPLAYGFYLGAATFERDEPRGPSLRPSLPMIWLSMLLLLLISAVLAVCCFRRQKQLHFGAAWGWAIFVFLIGIPGYLAYRFHRPWPTVDHCPRCEAVTPVRTGGCANCEAEFPVPEKTGVEVFA